MIWRKQQEQIAEPFLKRVVERIDTQGEVVAYGLAPTGATMAYSSAYRDPGRGWLRCDGTIYLVSQYPGLYNVIGNTFGGTAGSTFAVPTTANTIIKT